VLLTQQVEDVVGLEYSKSHDSVLLLKSDGSITDACNKPTQLFGDAKDKSVVFGEGVAVCMSQTNGKVSGMVEVMQL
jgi:hypothetical protein